MVTVGRWRRVLFMLGHVSCMIRQSILYCTSSWRPVPRNVLSLHLFSIRWIPSLASIEYPTYPLCYAASKN
ncbi:hypothetical protein BDR22DRAFT_863823 [Usnea florida]